MNQKKMEDHFSSKKELEGMFDSLRDGIIERAVKAILEGEGKVKEGKGVSIFYKVDTLKGKRDIELEVEFFIKVKGGEMCVEFHLCDINFHKVGTLTDSAIDNMNDYMRRGAEVLKNGEDTMITKMKK